MQAEELKDSTSSVWIPVAPLNGGQLVEETFYDIDEGIRDSVARENFH